MNETPQHGAPRRVIAAATAALALAAGLVALDGAAYASITKAAPSKTTSANARTARVSVAPTPTDTEGAPAITKVRVLTEAPFLEIYWDESVDETAATDVANYTLTNGDTVITLEPKRDDYTNTLYFDRSNCELAATEANVMAQIDPDLHMASIGYVGEIDPDQPLTLTVDGRDITDADGNPTASRSHDVPVEDYYTQRLTTKTGIVVKADDTVAADSLAAAGAQVDVELGRTDNGIAASMAGNHASLAVYSPQENVYLLPEHRGWFNKDMYAVEGYGGSMDNGAVSSIAERNILRLRGTEDGSDTGYPDENILIHEFGHAVKLVGMEQLEDQSLSREFQSLYHSRKDSGMWSNTYAIGNDDEFFATLATIWFDVMSEAPDFEDGVRSPVNTREDLKRYDPAAYSFCAKIFPDAYLPSPWAPADMPENRYVPEAYVPGSVLVNVAPRGEATASYTNAYLDEDAAGNVIDWNRDPGDNSYASWNNWGDPAGGSGASDFGDDGTAIGPWVQVAWDETQPLTQASLYFWHDDAGVPPGTAWKLQYREQSSGAWRDAPLAEGSGYTTLDGANTVTFEGTLNTDALRVVFPSGAIVGVGEFEAYVADMGEVTEPAPTPDPAPDPTPDPDPKPTPEPGDQGAGSSGAGAGSGASGATLSKTGAAVGAVLAAGLLFACAGCGVALLRGSARRR